MEMASSRHTWSGSILLKAGAFCWAFVCLLAGLASPSISTQEPGSLGIFGPGFGVGSPVHAEVGDTFHVEWVANGSIQFTLTLGTDIGGATVMEENSSYGYFNFEVKDNGLFVTSLPYFGYLTSEPSADGQYRLNLVNVDNHSVAMYHYVSYTRSTADNKIEQWNALIWPLTIAAVAIVAMLAVLYMVLWRKKKGV